MQYGSLGPNVKNTDFTHYARCLDIITLDEVVAIPASLLVTIVTPLVNLVMPTWPMFTTFPGMYLDCCSRAGLRNAAVASYITVYLQLHNRLYLYPCCWAIARERNRGYTKLSAQKRTAGEKRKYLNTAYWQNIDMILKILQHCTNEY